MNKVERVHAEERFVQLAADCIRLLHPSSAWLARRGRIGQTGLTDRALAEAIKRLETWISEQTGQG
jgi:hypothetical protein